MPHTAETRSASLIRPVVLVVDDDPAVLESLQSLLTPLVQPAYRVETAASAEEALELVADMNSGDAPRHPLALVITDERMPGRAGTDLLVALRESRAHRFGGRIIITAYAGLPSAQRAINEADVDRYYPKPWDTERDLIPAIQQVLLRFAHKFGLDELRIAEVVDYSQRREEILAVRRAWWEFVHLMGMPAEEMGVDIPPLEDPADADSIHVIAERRSPRERTVVGSLRLEKGAMDWRISSLAFSPEEATEEMETLILRIATFEAARQGARRLTMDAPALRHDVYARLGFAAEGQSTAGAGLIPMTLTLAVSSDTYAARFARDQRLCSCSQPDCVRHDFAAERRSYFCPLDQLEGRVPNSFIGITKTIS